MNPSIARDLKTIFDYMDGALSLEEAALQLENTDMTLDEVKEFLRQQPRYNVVYLNEHRV